MTWTDWLLVFAVFALLAVIALTFAFMQSIDGVDDD